MPQTTVSSKGSIVIPQEVREKYDIRAASKVEVVDLDGQIMIFPIPKNTIKAARGMLHFKGSALEIMRKYRKEELEMEKRKR